MKRSKTIFALLLALTLLLGLTPVAFADGTFVVSYGGKLPDDSANFYRFGIVCYDTEGKIADASTVPAGGSVRVQFVAKTGHTSPTEIKYTQDGGQEETLTLNYDGKGTISNIQGNITIKQVTTGGDVTNYAVSHNEKGDGIASYSILSYDNPNRSFANQNNGLVNKGGKVVVKLELQTGYKYPETISYNTNQSVTGKNGVYTLKDVSSDITFVQFTAEKANVDEADSFGVKLNDTPVDTASVVEDRYSVKSYAQSSTRPAPATA